MLAKGSGLAFAPESKREASAFIERFTLVGLPAFARLHDADSLVELMFRFDEFSGSTRVGGFNSPDSINYTAVAVQMAGQAGRAREILDNAFRGTLPRTYLIYSSLFYSLYKLTQLQNKDGSDWNEGAAIVLISLLGALVLFVCESLLLRYTSFSILNSRATQWLPQVLHRVWCFPALIILNGIYFLSDKRWQKLVQRIDALPKRQITMRYVISSIFSIAILVAYVALAVSQAES